MFKPIKIICSIALVLSSMSAQAGFVHTDLYAEGDERSYLHEETGIEWLKVTNTTNMSVNQVLAQTQQGGEYEGWRVPSSDELLTLWNGVFEGSSMLNDPQGARVSYSLYGAQPQRWVEFNGSQTTSPIRSYGIGYRLDGELSFFGVSRTSSTSYWIGVGAVSMDYTNVYAGVFLVSDGGITLSSKLNPLLNINNPLYFANNVSITSAMGGLVMLGLGFGASRRRKSE